MSKKITIIDYGMGNLYSVQNALRSIGAEPVVTSDAAVIAQAEKILLPGVGAFGDCMANLEKSGLIPRDYGQPAQRQAFSRHLPGHAAFI